jgi:transcriptional regulator with XRE-family HTH domain
LELDEVDYGIFLAHYGVLRRSGRYPWGSGQTQYSRNKIFLDVVDDLRKEGLSDSVIAQGFGMSRNQLQGLRSVAKAQQKQADIVMAERLRDKGYSVNALAARMGIPESTARSLLSPGEKLKADTIQSIAGTLKKEVEQNPLIDVGKGVENRLNITSSKLDAALFALQEEGYGVHNISDPQAATKHYTKRLVLAAPGISARDAFIRREEIVPPMSQSNDGGKNFLGLKPPMVLDPKRLDVVYGPDGGSQADGMIHIRPNVPDISLGKENYAQVRIQVGPNHYAKGMAIYKDDLPDGVDVLFHTNKKNETGNKLDVLKEVSGDPLLPFGTLPSQIKDDKGNVTSVMNKVNEKGDWEKWSVNLSSQFLSKQSPELAKSQLDMTYERRQSEFNELKSLTNPTVRKKLLNDFADGTAAASMHMKARSLPQQSVAVILPLSTIKQGEVFAPRHVNGERVVLVRHPHGGTFELPELIVNNRNREGRKLLGPDAADAIGIHHEVAKHLSGADFDGDTVLVIPNNRGLIKTTPPLRELQGFDPHFTYRGHEGMAVMKNTQTQMGMISNLITDMTLKGAPPDELARAVKHSMVVIDAEKHKLNYKLSYNDNNIKELKKKYQSEPGATRAGGASTLISKRKQEIRNARPQTEPRPYKLGGPVDKVTGELVRVPTGKLKKDGTPVMETVRVLAEVKDARTLMSNNGVGVRMERLYADHSNRLRGLSNQARLASVNTPLGKTSKSAKKVYAKEVDSLNAKLDIALRTKPIERQANTIANKTIRLRKDANPTMDEDTEKKIRFQALTEARNRLGIGGKNRIEITQDEWDAIQAGAVSDSKLKSILDYADMDRVRELATPKTRKTVTNTMLQRAEQMQAQGYTVREIADQLGVNINTLEAAQSEEG